MILKGKLQYSGILKLVINPEEMNLDTKGLVLNRKLHVTLVHQKIFKLLEYEGKKFSKHLQKNEIKNKDMEFEIDINLQSATIFEENEKEVLVFFVTEQSQKELDILVQIFFKEYGLQKEFNDIRPDTEDSGRQFHISYANKSGNPFDSIAIVW